MGHKVTVSSFERLVFEVNGSGKANHVLLGRQPINQKFDTVYIRYFFPYISEALFLAEWAHRNGLRVIDRSLATENYIQSKIYGSWKLAEADLPVIPGFQTTSLKQAVSRLARQKNPIIAKGIHGSKGKYVFSLDNPKNDAKNLNENLVGFFTFQDRMEIDEEYRILVIGGKYFGAIKKIAPEGDFRHNISVGAVAEKTTLNKSLQILSQKAAKTMGYEFAGVDLAISKGKPYILEVNRCPGFSGFEEATGMNVAKRFLEMIESK